MFLTSKHQGTMSHSYFKSKPILMFAFTIESTGIYFWNQGQHDF